MVSVLAASQILCFHEIHDAVNCRSYVCWLSCLNEFSQSVGVSMLTFEIKEYAGHTDVLQIGK